jgi:hypothetical protein
VGLVDIEVAVLNEKDVAQFIDISIILFNRMVGRCHLSKDFLSQPLRAVHPFRRTRVTVSALDDKDFLDQASPLRISPDGALRFKEHVVAITLVIDMLYKPSSLPVIVDDEFDVEITDDLG